MSPELREVHRQRGDLGEDVTLKTAHGEAVFATGDRIQFSGNGYGKKAQRAGLAPIIAATEAIARGQALFSSSNQTLAALRIGRRMTEGKGNPALAGIQGRRAAD